jgi:peptidoglycan/LPS O-acetylase OafA/YrhL
VRRYLALFSLIGLTIGIVWFTFIFLLDRGMQYEEYRAWLSILLSFTSLISNAAISYYFVKKRGRNARRSRNRQAAS